MADKNKIATFEQLKMLALRAKEDSTARIAELANLVIAGLEDAQAVGITVVLPIANWNEKAQTVQNEFFLADGSYWYFAYGGIGVNADDITVDGQITFQCEDVPDIDATINILRVEVNAGDTSASIGKIFNLTESKALKTYIDERFGDFYDALINERPIYFGLCDSDSKAILDSSNNGIAGKVLFQIK